MKHFAKFAVACAIALTASTVGAAADACSGRSHDTGTALGAGGGALIGSALTGGSAGGAIAGGILGAGTGALIGNSVTAPRHHRCARWGRDQWGNHVCRAWY